MGDRETGLSIFWADAGIDTGPVLLRKRIPIGPEDTTGALYFNRLFPLGVEAIVESVGLIKEGRAPRMVQDEGVATYEPLCNDQGRPDRLGKTRSRSPQPHPGLRSPAGGLLLYRGKKVRFFETRLVETGRPDARPGEILASDEGGFTVAARGGAVRIGKVRTEAGKQDAIAFAAETGLQPGKPSRQTVKAAGKAIREFSTDDHPCRHFSSPGTSRSMSSRRSRESMTGATVSTCGQDCRRERCRSQTGCIPAASEPQTSIRQSSPHRPPRSVQSPIDRDRGERAADPASRERPFPGYDDHFKEPHQLRIVAEAVLPHLRLPLGIGDQGQTVPPPQGPSGPPPPPEKYGSSP